MEASPKKLYSILCDVAGTRELIDAKKTADNNLKKFYIEINKIEDAVKVCLNIC
jgi:hypothetical protein